MALGLESGTVRLVPHDTGWAALFAAEAERIRSALGPELTLALEHTGSTAVPGLVAKPVLDLLGGYPPGAQVAPYVAALGRAGYVHRGEQGIPGREFFRRGEPRAYHLHLVAQQCPFWREHLAFRDALRAQPALRDAYAALKLELAQRHPRDREAYTEGKSAFVHQVVAQMLARRETKAPGVMHAVAPIELRRESPDALAAYATISSAFDVRDAVDVARVGGARSSLPRRAVSPPFRKDYDAVTGNEPLAWSTRFALDRAYIVVAETVTNLVGGAVVILEPSDVARLGGEAGFALLWDLRVAPEERGHGLGRALLHAAEAAARQAGVAGIAAETQDINVAACELYARAGYEIVRIVPGAYRELPGEVQILWAKSFRDGRDPVDDR